MAARLRRWSMPASAATILKPFVPSVHSILYFYTLQHLADWVTPFPRSQHPPPPLLYFLHITSPLSCSLRAGELGAIIISNMRYWYSLLPKTLKSFPASSVVSMLRGCCFLAHFDRVTTSTQNPLIFVGTSLRLWIWLSFIRESKVLFSLYILNLSIQKCFNRFFDKTM